MVIDILEATMVRIEDVCYSPKAISPMNKAMKAHLDALGYTADMQFDFCKLM